MTDRPADPEALRAEIAQTRIDLGDTVAALTAKVDVKARTKKAASRAVDDVKSKVLAVTGQASSAVGQARDRVSTSAVAARDAVTDLDVADTVRKPVPIAVVAGAAALIVIAILVWRRRR